MARRTTRPAAPANDPPRKAATAVGRSVHDAVLRERNAARSALDDAMTRIDTLTRRAEDAEQAYAGTLALRGEYERVVKERDEARARAAEATTDLNLLKIGANADRNTIDRLRRNMDAANYRAACAEADAVTARKALAEQAVITAVVTRDLRAARRDEAEMDRLNPRGEAAPPDRSTYDGPLAASEHDADD